MTAHVVAALLAVFAAPLFVQGQDTAPPSLAWQAVREGPTTGQVNELLESASGVILARVDDVLYRSTDDGRSWRSCRGLPPPPADRPSSFNTPWLWHTLAHHLRDRTAGYSQVELDVTDARCEEFGTAAVPRWGGSHGDSLAFLESGEYRIAVTPDGMFRTKDRGQTWQQTLAFRSGTVCAAQSTLRALFVIAGTRLYRSADEGASWVLIPEDATADRTGAVKSGQSPRLGCPFFRASNYSSLYAAGPDGVWRGSLDEHPSWSRIFGGRVAGITATERRVSLWTETPEAQVLHRSEDEGASWATVPLTLDKDIRLARLVDTHKGALLAGSDAGLFRSTDGGRSWTPTGVHPEHVSLAADGQRMYASSASGLWASRDSGQSWQRLPATIDGRPWRQGDQLSRLFDSAGRTGAFVGGRLFRLSGDGRAFTPAGLDHDVMSLVHVRGTWYAATRERVFRSNDFAKWTECSLGLRGGGPLVVISQGDLLSGSRSLSTDGCRMWWPFETTNERSDLVGYDGSPSFVFSRRRELVAMGNGIARLDLDTRVWSDVKEPTELIVTSAAVDDKGRFWMGTAHGVYVLMPDQLGYEVISMGLQDEPIVSLALDRRYLVAAVKGRGLFRAALP